MRRVRKKNLPSRGSIERAHTFLLNKTAGTGRYGICSEAEQFIFSQE